LISAVTECLEYLDFSCVVLYGHLIVGFAFMVPDVSYNEAYVSYLFTHPEWRGAGIATFTLYHLIQSCMGKDVTLHVAKDNPALNLYHKFGFKMNAFLQSIQRLLIEMASPWLFNGPAYVEAIFFFARTRFYANHGHGTHWWTRWRSRCRTFTTSTFQQIRPAAITPSSRDSPGEVRGASVAAPDRSDCIIQ